MTTEVYRALFAPSAVALVGASDVVGKATARPLEFLRRHGWAGEVYPVNPSRETVLGERAWASLEDLPAVPEHALVLTPADAAVEAVRQCADLGVTVATVVADGFLPGTADGDRRRQQLREILDGSTLRLLGPSSLGVATIASGLALTGNAAFAERTLPAGDVFVASQSGSVLGALLSRGVEMGVGFAGMVSVGNEFDVSLGEVCHAAVDDPAVAGFALFLENLGHADQLADFARAAAAKGKPVVAYKLGRSEDGARLSVSHTGALAGDDAVAEAFFRAHSIARVTTFDALLEAQLLARRIPVSASSERRVAVVSTTGGGGAMAVDCLAAAGLRVTAPAPTTAERLAALGVVVGHGALIDLTLSGTSYETIKGALDVLLAAPEFDAVIAVPGSSARFSPEVSVKPIVDSATADTALGVFVVPSAPDALRLLRRCGVPAFRSAESLADAMTAVFNREPVRPAVAAAPVTGSGAVTLDEDASYAVLERLGIRAAPRVVVDVDRMPSELPVPGPAVVKVLSGSLPHKSDVGGVVLGIADAHQLRDAASDIRSAVAAARPGFTIERLLVQEMVQGVAEVLIGFRRDADVGPVVVLAAGGVLAEVYRDRSVRTAPVDLDQAHAMIGEVRGLAVAAGFRGAPRGDLGALAEAIVAMSQLATAVEPTVIEAEANPIMVLAEGKGVVAVDAVVTVAGVGVMTAPTGVAGALADRAFRLRKADFGPAVEAAARNAFVDWLAATLGGSNQPIVAALLDGLEPGSGSSRIVGRGMRAVPSLAALVNGSAAHSLELDDIYSPGLFHPGAPVVAAALAVADQHDVNFGRLLRAIVVGYEVGGRLSADLGPSHYRHWHTTGTAGAVAAAAAVGDLVELDAPRLGHALALAATTTGGLQQTFRSDAGGKPLHAGAAAQAGVVAVAAARGGVTGAADVFEGPAGFGAATRTTTEWAQSRSGPDAPLVIERITVKPYPCCGHTFAAIDAALELRTQGLAVSDIDEIVVDTYATAVATAGIAAPRTDAERKFSLAHLVSAALVLGPDGMFAAAASTDPGTQRLVPRVRLAVDEQFEERFPTRRGARVHVVLADGRRRAVDVPDRAGSPERPLTAQRLADKFVTTAETVLGDGARAAHAALSALPLDAPVRALDVG